VGSQSQPVDNEAMACNWLQSQYECQPGSASTVTKMELYKHYVSACSVCGLQQIVSPAAFASCVRYDHSALEINYSSSVDICKVL